MVESAKFPRTWATMEADNRALWEDRNVAEKYARLEGFLPFEEGLFARFIPADCSVLDIGVGAGRTTGLLARRVRRYVGIDYSAEMVDRCRRRFPSMDIRRADARDLSAFTDGEFAAVLFSYNGIDYLYPDAARHQCLTEIQRVLAPGGKFVFSCHNSQAVLPEIDWTWKPMLNLKRVYWALRMPQTRQRLGALLRGRAWRRCGYVFDDALAPGKGAEKSNCLVTHQASVGAVIAETCRFGFRFLRLGSDRFSLRQRFTDSWVYYSFEKAVKGS
jgi:SAM-dependent methyltransferase